MAVQPIKKNDPTVIVGDDQIIFAGFTEEDQEVVAFITDGDDPEAAAHRALVIGARTLRVATTSIDAAMLERTAEELTASFARELEDQLERLKATTDELLDDED